MRKRLTLLFVAGLVLGGLGVHPAGAYDASLCGWWPLDDGSGTVAAEATGLAVKGTLFGNPAWSKDGKNGGCLMFDGTDDYVFIDGKFKLPNYTMAVWFRDDSPGQRDIISAYAPTVLHGILLEVGTDGRLRFLHRFPLGGAGGNSIYSPASYADGKWHHAAMTKSATEIVLYVDGKEVVRGPDTSVFGASDAFGIALGCLDNERALARMFLGAIDDLQIYYRALSAAEIPGTMLGLVDKAVAVSVSPANGTADVPRDTTLSWSAGQYAATHDVYFGTALADVNSATRTDKTGILASKGQVDTTFDPPGSLAYGQTYYWRIDEVNQAPDSTIFKGSVWSFTVEPYAYPITGVKATASSTQAGMGPEKTVDGSGMTGDQAGTDATTMWMSKGVLPNWIQYEFDASYKLYDLKVWNANQMIEPFIGFGAKDVTIEYSVDGVTWTTLAGVPPFAQGTGLAGYAANTTVSLGGVMAKYVKLTINKSWGGLASTGLSEVRFSYAPVQARVPQPANAATGVKIDTTLTWRPGREAGSHKVYFGTDQAAVTNGTVAAKTAADHSFTPGSLNFGTTYYWRVDEVNTVTYPGDVWSFTTTAYGVVDDFESYNDTDKRVYDAWIDGLTDGKSGSQVGYDAAPFAEKTIIHGGKQSMPLKYDNTAKFAFSEAVRTFDTAQNWTASGIKSLSLYFRGAADNGGQLYLKINGLKVSYNGSAGDLAKPAWTPWNIDLSTVGGSVSNVTKLTIGVEGAGSKGILYLDDIRLYPKTPEYITPVDPGKTNLVALYALDGNANDSSGKGNNGTVNGTGTWVPGVVNQALQFNGTATYVDCGSGASLNLTDAVTITAWIKMDFTAGDRKIAGNQDGTTGGYKFGLFTNNMVEFEIRTSANAGTLNRTSVGGTALQQGVWYHVAGVYSKGQYIRTYVYGNLDRELLTTAVLGSSTGTFKLGREPMSASYYWLGAMDDVEVYNRVLSSEEILWLAGQKTPVAKPF